LSIIAGIAGQPAELLDGAKVNSLIEYTSGNGVQLQGRTNGVAIEAGKVGWSESVSPAGYLTIVNGNTVQSFSTDVTTSVLPVGKYFVTVNGALRRVANGGTGGAYCAPALFLMAGATKIASIELLGYITAGLTRTTLDDIPYSMSGVITLTTPTAINVRCNNNVYLDATITTSILGSVLVAIRIA
jgi:hypothetical protein